MILVMGMIITRHGDHENAKAPHLPPSGSEGPTNHQPGYGDTAAKYGVGSVSATAPSVTAGGAIVTRS